MKNDAPSIIFQAMGKVIVVHPHLSLDEIDEFIRTSRHSSETRRWLIIRHAQADPSPSREWAKRFGVSISMVRKLIQLYNREGPYSIRKPRRPKAPNAYLSREEEKKFVSIRGSE